MTFRSRIALIFLALNAVGIVYLSYLVLGELKPRYREAVEESLTDSAEVFAAQIAQDALGGQLQLDQFIAGYQAAKQRKLGAVIYSFPKTTLDLRIYVTDAKGLLLYDSERPGNVGQDYSRWNDVQRTLQGKYGARTTRDDLSNPSSTVLYVAAPVILDGKIAGVVSVGKPAANINQFISRAQTKLVTLASAIFLAELIAVILMSLWITVPLKKLVQYADEVRVGKKAVAPRTSLPEVKELGAALEGMRAALEGKEYVEQYVQTLAHELKSPLAAIQASAEILHGNPAPGDAARFLRSIESEAVRMREALEALLELAKVERLPAIQDPTVVSVTEIITAAVERLGPLSSRRQIQILADIDPTLKVRGDKILLERVIENLLKNSIEFSPSGTTIEVRAWLDQLHIKVEIRDHGSGIPEFARNRIFDRFFSLQRPDGAKSSGIGLAIVKEIMELHAGAVEVLNAEGGGARALLTFPH